MQNTLKLASLVTFAVLLSLVLATGSPAQSPGESFQIGDPNLTIREALEMRDGAQAFAALVDVASARCPRFQRLLDRESQSLVALVPTNAAIAAWLRIDPSTFDGLDAFTIFDRWPELTAGRDVEPRRLCRLLRRHISRSEAQTVRELLDRGFITMLNGEEIPVSVGQGGVKLDYRVTVAVPDVSFMNGTVHYLDDTLEEESPPTSSDVVRVFQLGGMLNPSFGGLSGADALCQERADLRGLGGTWTAWLSDSTTDAIDRIPDRRYELLDGTLVAEDKADLTDGSLNAPINLTDSGGVVDQFIWTGTKSDGTREGTDPDEFCDDWTTVSSNTSTATVARGASGIITGGDWTNYQSNSVCSDNQTSIYCFGTTP